MSPSADLAAVLASLLLAGGAVLPAQDTAPTPGAYGVPQVQELAPRSQQLGPRSAELRANVMDLAGTARVGTTSTSVDVVLNANVLFGKDSAAIRPAARQRLAQVGNQLRDMGPGTLAITGHTDDLGSAEHGLELSRARAEAVRKQLGGNLSGMRVTVAGRGEAEPVAPNTDERSRALNRRVELHYSKA